MHHRILLAVLCVAAPPFAQAPAFRSGTNEIMVDVVVRDKQGRPLRGLKAADLTILEDGVPQTVTAFREVRSTAAPPANAASSASANPKPDAPADQPVHLARQVRLVSLVFERLGPEGRRLSRQAALDFLKRDLGANVYYGIFSIDRSFKVLQPYTADNALLQAAIERATAGERSDFANDSAGLSRAAATSQPSQGAAVGDGTSLSAQQANQIATEMLEFSANIAREELGRVSVFSLWAIIRELQNLPGRKAVVLFSEGLQLPNGVWQQFQSMISSANRANVTIYAIDARGLQAGGDSGANRAMLESAAARSQWARNTQTEDAAGQRSESRTFDLAMDSIRANQQIALAELAESTGGILMANTNDFRPFLAKLSDDFNTYYELLYRSSNPAYDGRFRNITVQVNRKEVTIQSRNGYFALPPMDGQTVYPYEVPLLTALGRNPLPRDLDFRAAVLQFRPREFLQESLLVFDLPLKSVTFVKDEKIGKYKTHLSVLSLVKDEQGHVVEKLSRDVPLNEPLDKLSGFQQGRFIVTRPLRLAPGRYTVESVAADLEGQRVAARKTVVVVVPRATGPQLSEIFLVRRLDKPAELRDLLDPLQLPQGRVVPTLADTVKGGPGAVLSVFFVLYPTPTAGSPQLFVELFRDGKLLTRNSPPLPAPDDMGVIPYLANTPMDALTPGQYEFRATLKQDDKGSQRSFIVNIE